MQVLHAFVPNALTLEQAFLVQRMPITEESLWPIVLQVLGAVHAVHNAGMAVRTIDLSTVLLSGRETIHLSHAGLLDLSIARGRDFAREMVAEMIGVGSSGWMADFGEYVPLDSTPFTNPYVPPPMRRVDVGQK